LLAAFYVEGSQSFVVGGTDEDQAACGDNGAADIGSAGIGIG
jgi:hypothetical protein